jgi:arylsulfatase A-like enzyme
VKCARDSRVTVPAFFALWEAVKSPRRLFLLAAWSLGVATSVVAKPNILFFAIDDQNDWIGALCGHTQAQTPHIDGLAKRGTLFSNAHAQSPLCNPSRSSLLTGLRPSSTGIYGLAPGIRDVEQTRTHVTLPQTYTQAGYFTFTCGKIYHDGSIKPKDHAAEFNEWGAAPGSTRPAKPIANLPEPRHPAMDWGPFPERDEDATDYKIASAAIEALKKAPPDKPFFVACGFRLPHVPCYAPQKWFDLYPDATLQMPPVLADDRRDTPRFSWYLHWTLPEPRLQTLKERNEWRPLVRAYLASTSFMDSQVGRVVAALEATGRAKDTLIVLWSDNGYHLGEKEITGKNTLWDRSTRVPLLFAGPGVTAGANSKQPAELLDIFPTLLELTGMPARPDLEGLSLVPQLKNAGARRERPAITTHNHDNHTIRNERWRYIRYADGSEELYDMQADPNEWKNLAGDSKFAATKTELAKWLPKVNKKPVPGSKSRILTYDPVTEEVFWEEKPIGKNEPIPMF